MAKQTGLGATVSVDDAVPALQNISNDVTSFSIKTERGMQEVTGVDKSALERIALAADGGVTLKGVFNPTANMSHDVFKTVCTTDVLRTCTIVLAGTPTATLTMEMRASNYNVERGDDGKLTWSVELMLANGTAPTWT